MRLGPCLDAHDRSGDVLTRNLDELSTVAADKGYDWEELRTRLRAESITPLIPQRDPGMRG